MMKRTLAKTILIVLAAVTVSTSLNAAKKPSAAATEKEDKQIVPVDASTPSFLDKKTQGKEKRAHHLAEKAATREFLNSPDGITFKKQIASTDDEINAVYEKNLNVFREDPEKGKKLSAEMERQVQILKQKRDKIEAEFEKLRKNSPVYRTMFEKHLKSELGQLKGRLKSKPSEEPEENEGNQ